MAIRTPIFFLQSQYHQILITLTVFIINIIFVIIKLFSCSTNLHNMKYLKKNTRKCYNGEFELWHQLENKALKLNTRVKFWLIYFKYLGIPNYKLGGSEVSFSSPNCVNGDYSNDLVRLVFRIIFFVSKISPGRILPRVIVFRRIEPKK